MNNGLNPKRPIEHVSYARNEVENLVWFHVCLSFLLLALFRSINALKLSDANYWRYVCAPNPHLMGYETYEKFVYLQSLASSRCVTFIWITFTFCLRFEIYSVAWIAHTHTQRRIESDKKDNRIIADRKNRIFIMCRSDLRNENNNNQLVRLWSLTMKMGIDTSIWIGCV